MADKGIKTVEYDGEIYANVEDLISQIAEIQGRNKSKADVTIALEQIMKGLDSLLHEEK